MCEEQPVPLAQSSGRLLDGFTGAACAADLSETVGPSGALSRGAADRSQPWGATGQTARWENSRVTICLLVMTVDAVDAIVRGPPTS